MCYSVLFFKHPIAPKNLCGFFKRAKVIIFFKSTKSRMSYFTVFLMSFCSAGAPISLR